MQAGVLDLAESSACSRFRIRRCYLPHLVRYCVGTLISVHFAAQYPACLYPCQRFTSSLATSRAWSRGRWIAIPSPCDSFIHYSAPVYPGAHRSYTES